MHAKRQEGEQLGLKHLPLGLLVVILTASSPAQNNNIDPIGELKRLSRGTKTTLSPSSAYAIATEMARPLATDAVVIHRVAELLAQEQLDWKDGRKSALNEARVVKALNRHLQLESGPEYLQVRVPDFRRIRVAIWIELPDLSTGSDRRSAQKGSQALMPTMSPFEAYLTCGLVLYQKLYNDEYVLTTAEAASRGIDARRVIKPGLYADRPNPRRTEFQNKLSVIGQKWSTVDQMVAELASILEESRNE